MKNRNRKGQYAHLDREAQTADERAEFQEGVARLMANQTAPIVIVKNRYSSTDKRAAEIADLETKRNEAENRGNFFQVRLYNAEILRLSR